MRIQTDESIAVIIDIQERLFPFIHDNSRLLDNVTVLMKGLRILKIPMIVTRQYPKGIGDTVGPIRELTGDSAPVDKTAFSCCDEPSFSGKLAGTGKRFVIIAGIEAHICVLQTVTDLVRDGYVPAVVEDCISSRRANDKRTALLRMRSEGAYLTTYESLLYELCRYSGTDEFRQMLSLVK